VPTSSLLDKCCLLGQSVAGNPTHYMIEQALSAADLDWRFLTFEVTPAHLAAALRGLEVLGFHGVKLDESLAELAAKHVSEQTELACRAGTVDCLVRTGERLVGHSIAGQALVKLVERSESLRGQQVLISGAGTQARTIGAALAATEVGRILIVSPDDDVTQTLVSQLNDGTASAIAEMVIWPDEAFVIPANTRLFVRTAPTSKSPELPLDPQSITKQTIVADLEIGASRSPLLRTASGRGAVTIDGTQAFVAEIALALRLWTGVDVNETVLRDAAEEFMGM
jgi:shikimate dehydrogenase